MSGSPRDEIWLVGDAICVREVWDALCTGLDVIMRPTHTALRSVESAWTPHAEIATTRLK